MSQTYKKAPQNLDNAIPATMIDHSKEGDPSVAYFIIHSEATTSSSKPEDSIIELCVYPDKRLTIRQRVGTKVIKEIPLGPAKMGHVLELQDRIDALTNSLF